MIVAFAGHDSGSLVYHLAWRYAEERHKVLAVDASPGCELTCRFFDETTRARLWAPSVRRTFPDAVADAIVNRENPAPAVIHPIAPGLAMLAGRPSARGVDTGILESLVGESDEGEPREDRLERLFAGAVRALWEALNSTDANVALVDLGPDFGGMSGSVVLTADHVVNLVATDAISLARLHAQVAHLDAWCALSQKPGIDRVRDPEVGYGTLKRAGYVVTVTTNNTRAIMAGIPATFVGHPERAGDHLTFANDPNCLGVLHTYPGLESQAREAGKPIFQLTAADGALGSHAAAVTHARNAYQRLADRIAAATWRGDTLSELAK